MVRVESFIVVVKMYCCRYAPESLAHVDDSTTGMTAATAEGLNPHEYTNVQLAQANKQGHSHRIATSHARRPKL